MMTYVLFVLGFAILIKGADLLVDGAVSFAINLCISPIVIGLTIVAFGTSMPEFIVNIFASARGNTEIAIGNILGSNIFNILFILGISSIISSLISQKNTVWKEIPFSLLAAVLVGVMANDYRIDGGEFSGLTRIDGIVLIAFFIIFLYYTFGLAKVTGEIPGPEDNQKRSIFMSVFYILIGLAGLIMGGKWIVEGAVKIAQNLRVSESLIGLTIIAAGTSLPELATSAVAAYKKQSDIAVGNIVGSNIFNIFWILGVSSLIRPLPFSENSDSDVIMTIASSAIIFIILIIGKNHTLRRWHGFFMILIYLAYIVYLIQKEKAVGG